MSTALISFPLSFPFVRKHQRYGLHQIQAFKRGGVKKILKGKILHTSLAIIRHDSDGNFLIELNFLTLIKKPNGRSDHVTLQENFLGFVGGPAAADVYKRQQEIFYHKHQMGLWSTLKVDRIKEIYKAICLDFHKPFSEEELLMNTYIDLGARNRLYQEFKNGNNEFLTIDKYCLYHIRCV